MRTIIAHLLDLDSELLIVRLGPMRVIQDQVGWVRLFTPFYKWMDTVLEVSRHAYGRFKPQTLRESLPGTRSVPT